MEKIRVIDSNGRGLAVNQYLPQTDSKKLAILCPGYLQSKDYDHLVELANQLVSKGYTVFSFDPIGTWESDGDISEYTITQYLVDVKSVLDNALLQRSYDHILLGGHSRGGGVSILYAAKDQRISEVLGIMASPLNPFSKERHDNWKNKGVEISRQVIPGTDELREYAVPFSYVEDRAKYNVVESVKNVHVPIVLISGGKDTLVTPDDVQRIYDSANEPKKLILVPEAVHDYRVSANQISLINQKILESLSK